MSSTETNQAIEFARRNLKRAEKFVAHTEAELAYFRALGHRQGIEIHETERQRALQILAGRRGALRLLQEGEE